MRKYFCKTATCCVAGPLAISGFEAFATPTGLPDLGRGLFLRTRDVAKFGQLLLDGGVWNGRRLLSQAFVEEAISSHSPARWAQPERWDWQMTGYGFLWWRGYFEWQGRRLEGFAAWGFAQQFAAVVPELGLVASINARLYDDGQGDPNPRYSPSLSTTCCRW